MNNIYNNNIGYIDKPIPSFLDVASEIVKLKKEKNAVLLSHFYQAPEIQDIADFVGDSLQLARQAASTKADIIVFAGVHFMAETAKILCPDKKVLIPDKNAGCSLADSCTAEDLKKYKEQNPDTEIIMYINTTAEVKAYTDIVCTSSNAVEVVQSIDPAKKILFGPDRNLGNYIAKLTGREMDIWNGACIVHEEFSIEKILQLKQDNPGAKILSHPECTKPILEISDFIGSTSQILQYSQKDSSTVYIVATESGILHQMKKETPHKTFIPAPPLDSTCACNECKFMRMITLPKLYNTLLYELPEIILPLDIIEKAIKPIERMLSLSKHIR